MSPRGKKRKPTIFKVQPRPVSPDDVRILIIERDRLAPILGPRQSGGSAIRRHISPHWRDGNNT
jgi:hypothetical protein